MSFRKTFGRVILFGSVASGGFAGMCYVNPEQFDNQLFYLYRKLPLKALSTVVGKMMALEISEKRRESVIGSFSRTVGADLSEAKDSDLKSYTSLNEFFTRELRTGARVFEKSSKPHQVWCPSDGKILQFGVIGESSQDGDQSKEQVSSDVVVKGQPFSLSQFLGPIQLGEGEKTSSRDVHNIVSYNATDLLSWSNDKKREGKRDGKSKWWGGIQKSRSSRDSTATCLYACVIYLSPKDCHRFYSPVEWTVNYVRHFSGSLLSVRPSVLKLFSRAATVSNSKTTNHSISRAMQQPNPLTAIVTDDSIVSSPSSEQSYGSRIDLSSVLSVQERCVMVGEWEHGFFSFTAVGATAVGSITINSCPQMQTNNRTIRNGLYHDYKVSSSKRSEDSSSSNLSKEGVKLSVGEEVGRFNLGSTIVLIFEAPKGLQLATNTENSYPKSILPTVASNGQRAANDGTKHKLNEVNRMASVDVDVDNDGTCKIGQCLFR